MRIGQVAREAGVTTDTLRFYEKRGLLGQRHMSRQTNGYRSYTEAALIRLRLIKLAQKMGFSLVEIEAYVQRWENGDIKKVEKAAIYDAQIRKIDEQLAELTRMRAYLHEKRVELDSVS